MTNTLCTYRSASTSTSGSSSSSSASSSPFFKQQPKRDEISAVETQIMRTSGLVSPLFTRRGREPRFLELEFDNGTACDLDAVNRSTVVEVYCGPA